MIPYRCVCGKQYSLSDDRAGKPTRCGACRRVFIAPCVPSQEGVQPAESRPAREAPAAERPSRPATGLVIGAAAAALGLVVALGVVLAIASRKKPAPPPLVPPPIPAVVSVEAWDRAFRKVGAGSGFVASKDGLIITCRHLVKGATRVGVKLPDGTERFAEAISAPDTEADLALLRLGVSTPNAPELHVAPLPKVGAKLRAGGNPEGRGIKWPACERSVPVQGVVTVDATPPISPQFSGGPLLDERGNLVGVTCCRKVGDQELVLAVPSERAEKLRSNPGLMRPLSGAPPELADARWLAEAWADTLRGEHAKAVEALAPRRDALKDVPGCWLCLGQAHAALKNLDQAADAYRKAAALDPKDAEAQLGLGDACFALKRYQECVAACEAAQAAGSTEPRIRQNMLAAYLEMAKEHLARKEYPQALAACEKALALDPKNADALVCKGDAYFAQKAHKECIDAYNAALAAGATEPRIRQNMVAAYLEIAREHLARKEYPPAIAACDKALALDPKNADALTCKGDAHFAQKEHKECVAAYEAALAAGATEPRIRQNLVTAHVELAKGHLARKEYPQAIGLCDKALALDPKNRDALTCKGDAHFALRAYKECIEAYRAALAAGAAEPRIHRNMATAYKEQGQKTEAIAALKKYLELKPDDKEARDELVRLTTPDTSGSLVSVEVWDRAFKGLGTASGFVASADGLIVARHSLAGAAQYGVKLPDGTERFAEEAAPREPKGDLVLLRVKAERLKPLDTGALPLPKPWDEVPAERLRKLPEARGQLRPIEGARPAEVADARRLAEAWAMVARKEDDKAVKALSERPDAFKAVPGYWLCLGKARWGLKDYKQGLDAHDMAAKLDPKDAEAQVGRGNCLFGLNQYEKCVEAYEAARKLDPELEKGPSWPAVRENMATAYLRMGDDYNRQGGTQEKGNLDNGKHEQAVAAYKDCLGLKPQMPTEAKAHLGMGKSLQELMRIREARAAYDSAERLDPKGPIGNEARALRERLPPNPPNGWEQVFERAAPAVVFLQVWDRVFRPTGLGSGFLVSQDGMIVTCHHVVEGAAHIGVKLPSDPSQRQHYAEGVVASDPDNDLAVVKVNGSGFRTLEIGPSTPPKVGADVGAIGSPLGLQNSLTKGIVSRGLSAEVMPDKKAVPCFQFDAAASPGSSGGPLIDGQGRVVGVVFLKRRGGENLNFAIPAERVSNLIKRVGPEKPFDNAGGRRLELADAWWLSEIWRLALEQRAYDKALQALDGRRQASGDFACYWCCVGFQHARQGKYDLAAEAYAQAVKRDPKEAEGHSGLGVCHLQRRRYAESIEEFKIAVQLAPRHPYAYVSMGEALAAQSQHREAIAAYRNHLTISPRDAGAHLRMARSYRALGQLEEAAEAYRAAAGLDPTGEAGRAAQDELRDMLQKGR